jgi:hypothetical protein
MYLVQGQSLLQADNHFSHKPLPERKHGTNGSLLGYRVDRLGWIGMDSLVASTSFKAFARPASFYGSQANSIIDTAKTEIP